MISIITTTLNSQNRIIDLIKSLNSQNYQEFEWVVVDGGSRDYTESIIRDNSNNFIFLTMPSSTIYEAWNYALKKVKHNWVMFLGDDDCFIDSKSLSLIVKKIQLLKKIKNKKNYLLSFQTLQEDASGNLNLSQNFDHKVIKTKMHYSMPIRHQALIHNKSIFAKIGYFDTSYRIAADYDFFIRATNNGFKPEYQLESILICSYGGVSTSYSKSYQASKEMISIQCKYNLIGCRLLNKYLIYLKSVIKFFLSKILDK